MVRTLTPTIPPKMYRHFALFTVLLTAGIAMFASGENREAVAAQIEERHQQEEFERASREKFGPPTIGRRTSATSRPAHFGQDSDVFDESFGRPMDQPVESGSSVEITSPESQSPAAQVGYSDRYLASLSEEERKLLLDGLEKEGLLSPAERQRRSAALIAASHNRSGGPMTIDD